MVIGVSMMGSNASAFGVSYLVRNASYLGVSSWSEMLATSAFLCWAETPRAVALLKGSDREILSRRVHFVTKFVERVRIVKKAATWCADVLNCHIHCNVGLLYISFFVTR